MTESYPTAQPGLPTGASAPKKRKKWPWVVGAIALVLAFGAAFGEADTDTAGTATAAPSNEAAVVPAPPAPAAPVAPVAPVAPAEAAVDAAPAVDAVLPVTTAASAPAPTEPQVSAGQRNALRSAEQYLQFTAFSRSGLIDQLAFEGFSTEDATYAADTVTVDWNEQAARSAEQYLDFTSFSRSGLVDQLVFEGFTAAQAEYGADAAY
ncbi:hypothetical protein DW322_00590 [Rhodococcus rhodnii]|uniref:Putative host cell surface-exposed lipoprotein Ltp-like HTH region domain-containing protein n=2 Tax=Rhodococcus rhodnii TaxID=38312 RepID=R7WQX8_9NOCA|nr:Ltp family lipoprotein [Rhodococcus rhodnii]EOM77723.1 hypothetical protein Rrhod_0875 [Rhodococcus rhodnii LMG 5362]TXG89007.1 hypothetical protein DW322_00590 [Rhodococcus rhodnii]